MEPTGQGAPGTRGAGVSLGHRWDMDGARGVNGAQMGAFGIVNLGLSSQQQAWKSEVLAGQGQWERDGAGASPMVLCFSPIPTAASKPQAGLLPLRCDLVSSFS